MVVSVHHSVDLSHFAQLAGFWLENQDVVVTDELGLIFFIRSDSEVANIFSDIDTAPVFVLVDVTGKIGERHTMGVSGGGAIWSVGINMSINPDDFGVWHESLHSSN